MPKFSNKNGITPDAGYFIVDLVMSILWLFMAIFLPTALISFTKLRFRQSFWAAQYVKYWFDQKLRQKAQKFSFLFFYHFVKQKSENLCLLKGNFKIISGYFLANYIHVFYKTEDQMVILRSLTCLNLNWIKAYDILLVKVFFSCLQMHDFKGTLWSEFFIPQNKISSHIFKIAGTETYYTSF